MSFASSNSMRMSSVPTAMSATDHGPTANPFSGRKLCKVSRWSRMMDDLWALPQEERFAVPFITLDSSHRPRKRARARRTGSAGRRFVCGKISAMNSTMASDSASFADSGEGSSGDVLGPP